MRRQGEATYHVISRVVDRRFVFGVREKNYFRFWMRRLEEFCGVQVVTFCLMSNHFHLLVRVADRERVEPLDEGCLRRLLPLIYRRQALKVAVEELDFAVQAARSGDERLLTQLLERYELRRHSLSAYLKELKQRFTQWFNARNDRVGTLWEDRFKSVLVENGQRALLTMAAYIDLNPVRAGIGDDPKDYLWAGYGEAVVGKLLARRGLGAILELSGYGTNRRITWATTAPRYRQLLYLHGEARDADEITGKPGRVGISRNAVEAELKRGGRLSLPEVLRCKVRYFVDGAVFGSEAFVDEVFEEQRDRFGVKRECGARRMRGADWGELRVLRDLQRAVLGDGPRL